MFQMLNLITTAQLSVGEYKASFIDRGIVVQNLETLLQETSFDLSVEIEAH